MNHLKYTCADCRFYLKSDDDDYHGTCELMEYFETQWFDVEAKHHACMGFQPKDRIIQVYLSLLNVLPPEMQEALEEGIKELPEFIEKLTKELGGVLLDE